MRKFLFLGVFIISLISNASFAQDFLSSPSSSFSSNSLQSNQFDNTEPEFLNVDQAYQAFLSFEENSLKIQWIISDGYYLYRHAFKASINNQAIELSQLPSGLAKHDEFFGDVEVYYQQLNVTISDIQAPANIEIQYQGCADAGLCYPPRIRYYSLTSDGFITELQTPPNKQSSATDSGVSSPLSADSEAPISLWLAIAFGLLGGLILNVMPCVFPVLSLKLLSLAESGHKQKHAWVYTAGVVSCFLIIAIVLSSLKSAGEQIGWGFQLQSPTFLWFLAYLFILLGLNMSGYIFFGSRLMGIGNNLTSDKGVKGDFFTGVLAVVVASPCSVPFMGTALGFAMTQSTLSALLVFTSLGLGMALPFILIASFPSLQKLLPRPGLWMEHFKQLLAFPLYLTVIWLLWVLGRQTDTSIMAIAATGCLLIIFCCWLSKFKSRLSLVTLLIAALLALYLPVFKATPATENNAWQNYSNSTLQQALNQQQAVFINATADWCITCISNELTTLHNEQVLQFFKNNQVLLLKADWTRQDPEITQLLNQHQRSGVPLYLWFAPGQQQAKILPQILTKSLILDLNAK